MFVIPGFRTFGCPECHDAEELLQRAVDRMRDVLRRLRRTVPQVKELPLRQYLIQSWADDLLQPRQLAHTTFDTIRISPRAVLIDTRIYGGATHLHESLHLTQSFLGIANELEAYSLNVRADPRFLLLNFPFFADVVTAFYLPDFPRHLDAFFARPVRETLAVPREAQWFADPYDPEFLQTLEGVIERMEPLFREVSRLNRTHPLKAAYLSAKTRIPSLLLDLAAVQRLPLPARKVSDSDRRKARAILETQMTKMDNLRLGYRIDRKKEALLTFQYQLKMKDPVRRLMLYYEYLKERFIDSDGRIRLTIQNPEDFRAYVRKVLGEIGTLANAKGMTPLEREAAEALIERLKKETAVTGE